MWVFHTKQLPETPAGCPAVVMCASDQLSMNQRFPWSLPWVQPFARAAHRTQGNTYLCLLVYYIIEERIKGTEEQSDEEVHKVRSGRVLSTGTPVPRELG